MDDGKIMINVGKKFGFVIGGGQFWWFEGCDEIFWCFDDIQQYFYLNEGVFQIFYNFLISMQCEKFGRLGEGWY